MPYRTVTSGLIVDKTIATADLADDAVTAAKFDGGALVGSAPAARSLFRTPSTALWSNEFEAAWEAEEMAGSTYEDDTEHVLAGTKSRKVTIGSGKAYAELATELDLPKDLQNTCILVRYYVHPGTGASAPANLKYVTVTFYTGYGGDNYYEGFNAFNGEYPDGEPALAGWHTVIIDRSNPTFVSGAVDWSAIDAVRVRVQGKEVAHTPAVTLDRVAAIPVMSKAYYMIFMDDSVDDFVQLAAALEARDLRGNFAVWTGRVGEANMVTWAQLDAMRQQGHCLCNHGRDSDMSPVLLTDMLNGARDLIENDHAQAARLLVTPGGQYPAWCGSSLGRYFEAVRTTTQADSFRGGIWYPYGARNRLHVAISHSGAWDAADVTAMNGRVDDAINAEYRGVCIVVTHGFDATHAAAHLDYVKAKRDNGDIQVVTLEELFHVL